jgi:ankyrin repeat protein
MSDDPLVAASRRGDLREMKERLQLGDTVDRRNPIGETALMAATGSGHTAVVDFLLEKGPISTLKTITAKRFSSARRGMATLTLCRDY